MDPRARQSAELLSRVAPALASHAVELQLERDDSFRERYGAATERFWRAQATERLAHLVEAIAAERPALLAANACWSRAALGARDVPAADVEAHLHALSDAMQANLPTELAARCTRYLGEAVGALRVVTPSEPRLTDACERDGTLARLYLLNLLQRDRDEAKKVVVEAQRNGMGLADIYGRIIVPAMREVGRMWHLEEASIADEHYCTAATHAIMAEVRLATPRAPWNGLRALCLAVDGDLHDLAVRMVSDVYEADGWQVEYLGASTPAADVVMSLSDERSADRCRFDLLSVGAGTSLVVRAVADLVDAVRSTPCGRTLPILVGGPPFCIVPDLWQVVGADACAGCPGEALAKANELARRGRPTPRATDAGRTGSP